MLRPSLLLCLLFFTTGFATAGTPEELVRERLLALQPDLPIEQLLPSVKQGWYQVQVRGGQFLYVDETAEFMFHGDLYHIQDAQVTNITQQARNQHQAELLKSLDENEMVIFPAKDSWTHITVFTDVDCTYCQKLHAEVPELNKLGVEVRYLAYPRQGLAGETYERLVSVWCADDPQEAMTQAKQRKRIPRKTCKHPVDKHYALGQTLGIQGTPAIILQNGDLLPGYLPAEQLARLAAGDQK